MIESMKDMERREVAKAAAEKIIAHPAYPFVNEWPRAMIIILENALKTWEEKLK